MENYRIYSREPIYFIRIILIAMAIFSFIMPIFIIFSIALLFIIIRDFKKCKSYIEFADSDIIIDDYQWWFLWYKVIFTKKEEFWNTETIKFYWLDDAKNFDKELKKRWVNSTWLNIW